MARRNRPSSSDESGPRLPEDLAPALRERVEALLRQVQPARLRRTPSGPAGTAGSGRTGRAHRGQRAQVNRCVVCHRPGKLGGHHDERSGDVVWVHAKCHRRHHRAHRRTRRGDRWWRAQIALPVAAG